MLVRLFRLGTAMAVFLPSMLYAQILSTDPQVRFARKLPSAELSLDKGVRLGPVTAAELFSMAGGGAIDEGVWTRTGGLTFQNPSQIIRSVDRLWRFRAPLGPLGDPLAAIDVSYSIMGANGNLEVLSHVDSPSEEVVVTVQPLPVVLIASTAKQVILEGGVTLKLDLESARLAGQYEGILTVIVNQF